jgi:hypothetical protein
VDGRAEAEPIEIVIATGALRAHAALACLAASLCPRVHH